MEWVLSKITGLLVLRHIKRCDHQKRMRNISLNCPACSVLSLMPIMHKGKEKDGKVLFTVWCPKCHHVFRSGMRPNLWRQLHNLGVPREQIFPMQFETVRTVFEESRVPKVERIGHEVFFDGKPWGPRG